MTVELDKHQTDAYREMHNGCLLKGDVGSGKSRTGLAYYFIKVCEGGLRINGKGDFFPPRKPRDLYIITTAKKRDKFEWEKECADFHLSSTREASVSGIQLTVDSWNNITNYEEVKDAFFIFDEQRLVGSGAWVKAFLKIAKANQWIVLSATPGDTWMDYCPIFVANGFYKNRTEFVHTHVVFSHHTNFPKIERYVETAKLERHRKQVLVDMPFHRHTMRHVLNELVEYNKELFDKVVVKRWHVFEDRPIKDVSEFFAVMRKVVNTDPSRVAAIMMLLEKHPKLIVFYNYNYELDMLRVMANVLSYPVGEWNGQKHQEIPEGEKWLYLVQYTAGAEGWNCVSTNAMAFWSLNYSWRIMEQAKGRIDRMNTPFVDLYYYVLRSMSPIDVAIIKTLGIKKDFNERAFIKGMGVKFDDPI